jgi:hypothetical protein
MIKSEKKVPVPKKIYPVDKENIQLTKEQFVAKRKKILERDALINAFAAKVDSGEIAIPGVTREEKSVTVTAVHEQPAQELPIEHTLQRPKKMGRPRKESKNDEA